MRPTRMTHEAVRKPSICLCTTLFILLMHGMGCGKKNPVGSMPDDPSEPKNQAPVAVGRIDNIDLIAGGAEESINVTRYFRDTDEDRLVFSAVSTNESIATVTVSGSVVRIRPISQGSTTVTVKATDTGRIKHQSGNSCIRVSTSTNSIRTVRPAGLDTSVSRQDRNTRDLHRLH